jgi:predicted MFS family arabinose efflux permease
MAVPLLRIRLHSVSVGTSRQDSSVKPIIPYLAGYFLYGAGYIAYLTFMIAYIRNDGGDAAAQSAFWCLIGLGGITAPWIWRGVMARGQSGVAMALMIGITAIGAALPLAGSSPWIYAASALIFGNGFLATTIATTAFTRFNYPEQAWPRVIAIITIIFSIGQILGPLITGAITDFTGTLSSALAVSAAALALGAVVSLFQRALPFSHGNGK